MWPLEKYARWDGKCWHQIDAEDSRLRLLVEVIINKIRWWLLCTALSVLILSHKFKYILKESVNKFWVSMVMEMLTVLHLSYEF